MIVTASGRRYVNYRLRQMIFRRICFIISLFIFSVGVAFFAARIFANAQTSNDVQYYKYYTSIVVYPGDTLESIAEEYGDHFDSDSAFIKEVINTNHLNDADIRPGVSLIVPYFSTEFKQ